MGLLTSVLHSLPLPQPLFTEWLMKSMEPLSYRVFESLAVRFVVAGVIASLVATSALCQAMYIMR